MEIDHKPFFSPIFSPRSQSPSSFRPNVFSLLFKFKQVHFFVYRQPFHFPVQLSPLSQVLLSYPSEQLPLLSIALLVQVAPPSLLSFVLLGVCLLRTNDSFLFFLFLFFFFQFFNQLEANYFTILQWVFFFLPYIDMNQPQIYMCSPS